MIKRGQITIFVILGIVLIVALVLVGVFKGEEVKKGVEKQITSVGSMSEYVAEVEVIVQDCLEHSMIETFAELGVGAIGNYKEDFGKILKFKVLECVDFSSVNAKVVSEGIDSVDVSYAAGNTKIQVNLNYDISIEKDENVKRLNKFYSEVSIIPECCIPVQVDGNCKAKESSNVVSCGRLFKIDQGESLEMDGECSAC
ncbi:hypothetical protein COV16_00405 [Candidatus Woesearchaeota archaeon CG10_big_fil_rev_8_21_14_0_10_34_8]|jgi:ABC-type antimicrobial peptide transport system permease subunit|nr:MAG: hypothetical protein COV16_00405 [Candidatus Woesearchaeota archaeon CG10_big_fil_rev_8_21_14_0_10_34_8]